jgi:hypothetical protein
MKRIRMGSGLGMSLLALAAGWAAAAADSDLVSVTRSRFPERLWTPLTAADAALVGAGRAADPASGWSANPALLRLEPGNRLRATGTLLNPQRNDVKSSVREYSDSSPLVTFGEAGAVVAKGSVAWGLYLTQDAFDKAHESFIDTAAGSAPVPRDNEFTSSLARAGLAAAYRQGRFSVGAALELSRPTESWKTVEQLVIYPEPVTRELRADGLVVGGALGAVVAANEWLAIGAVGRLAGGTDLEDEDGATVGHDEVPFAAGLGVHLGRSAGGNLHLSAEYAGPRDVTLADSLGGAARDPERVRLAAGYAYASPVMPWEFRAGLGWSPYPGDGAARYNSFGVGVGYRLEGSVVRATYARERRNTPEGDSSARSFMVFGLDVRF